MLRWQGESLPNKIKTIKKKRRHYCQGDEIPGSHPSHLPTFFLSSHPFNHFFPYPIKRITLTLPPSLCYIPATLFKAGISHFLLELSYQLSNWPSCRSHFLASSWSPLSRLIQYYQNAFSKTQLRWNYPLLHNCKYFNYSPLISE